MDSELRIFRTKGTERRHLSSITTAGFCLVTGHLTGGPDTDELGTLDIVDGAV